MSFECKKALIERLSLPSIPGTSVSLHKDILADLVTSTRTTLELLTKETADDGFGWQPLIPLELVADNTSLQDIDTLHAFGNSWVPPLVDVMKGTCDDNEPNVSLLITLHESLAHEPRISFDLCYDLMIEVEEPIEEQTSNLPNLSSVAARLSKQMVSLLLPVLLIAHFFCMHNNIHIFSLTMHELLNIYTLV